MPRITLAAALGAAVLAACAPAAFATDRYMAVDGVDNGWCTDPAQPCANLEYVHDNSQAGDTIHLAAGTYSVASMGAREVIQRNLVGAQAGVPVPERLGQPETELPLVDDEGGYTVLQGEIDGVSFPATSTGGVPTEAVEFLGTGALRNSIVFTGADAIDASAAGPGSVIDLEGNIAAGFDAAVRLGDGTYTVSRSSLLAVFGDALRVDGAAALEATGNELIGGRAAVRLGDDITSAELHGNRIAGGGMTDGSIVYAQHTPIVDAEDNWWSCNAGAGGGSGCAPAPVGFVDTTPWLTLSTKADPDAVRPGGTADLIASMRRNSAGEETDFDILWGFQPVTFGVSDGTLSAASAYFGPDARAKVRWTAPTTPGPVGWSVVFDSATVNDSIQVQPGDPVATVSPRGLNFGTQAIGVSSAPQTVTVTNDGDGPLRVAGYSGKGTGASLFAVTNDTCVGTDVDPGETCAFDVRFTPSKDGTWTPKIEVVSNAPKVAVGLRGTGVPRMTVTPGSGDFGSVQRRTTSSITFQMTNHGATPLPTTSLRLSGTGKSLFSIDPGTCTGSLPGNGVCTLSVTFAPLAAGTWSPDLLVEANRVVKVPLTGTGVR